MPTGIEWCHETQNFWWGCTKISETCRDCYAEGVAQRFRLNGERVTWGPGQPRVRNTDAVWQAPHVLNRKAQRLNTRYRVFVNSMSDFFDEEAPQAWRDEACGIMEDCTYLDGSCSRSDLRTSLRWFQRIGWSTGLPTSGSAQQPRPKSATRNASSTCCRCRRTSSTYPWRLYSAPWTCRPLWASATRTSWATQVSSSPTPTSPLRVPRACPSTTRG